MAIEKEIDVCFREPSNSVFAITTEIVATAPSNFYYGGSDYNLRELSLIENTGRFLFAEMVDISEGSVLSEIMTDKKDPEAINITSELKNVSSYIYGRIKREFPGVPFTIKQESESGAQNRSLLIYKVQIKKKNGKVARFRFYPEVHSWEIIEKTIKGIVDSKKEEK